MNQTFDMRLDIKTAAPRTNKPAVKKADKPASDSDFHKTLENATAPKQQPKENSVQKEQPSAQKSAVSKPEAQTEKGVMQEDTVDLQNVAAMMAATVMPTIVMPEQTTEPVMEEAVQSVFAAGTEELTPAAQTVVQDTMQRQPKDQKTAAPVLQQKQQAVQTTEQQGQSMQQVRSATEQQTSVTDVKQQGDFTSKLAESQGNAMQKGQDTNTAVVTEVGAAIQPEKPLFENVEATPIQVAEPVHTEEPDFPMQLAQRIDQASAQGVDTIEVQLTPHELGKITIRLTATEEGIQISMHSANSKTVGLLTEHAANIGAMVEQNHSGVVTVSVEHEQQQNQYAQQEHQGGGQQQQQQQQHRHAPPQNDDFIQQLRLGLAGLS